MRKIIHSHTCKACWSEGRGVIRSPGGLLDSDEKSLSHSWRCLGVRAPLPFSFQSLPARMVRALWALPEVLNSENKNIHSYSVIKGQEKWFPYKLEPDEGSRGRTIIRGSCLHLLCTVGELIWWTFPFSDLCYHHPQAPPPGTHRVADLLRKQYFFCFPLSLGRITASRPRKWSHCWNMCSLKASLTPDR